jgi:hypothetical protein
MEMFRYHAVNVFDHEEKTREEAGRMNNGTYVLVLFLLINNGLNDAAFCLCLEEHSLKRGVKFSSSNKKSGTRKPLKCAYRCSHISV